jgi:hypothetical protein
MQRFKGGKPTVCAAVALVLTVRAVVLAVTQVGGRDTLPATTPQVRHRTKLR